MVPCQHAIQSVLVVWLQTCGTSSQQVLDPEGSGTALGRQMCTGHCRSNPERRQISEHLGLTHAENLTVYADGNLVSTWALPNAETLTVYDD